MSDASESLCQVSSILRFAQETAENYGTRTTPAGQAENGYSPDGWNGMAVILEMAREKLERIQRERA